MTYDESIVLKCIDLLARQMAALAAKGACKKVVDKPTSDHRSVVKATITAQHSGFCQLALTLKPVQDGEPGDDDAQTP